MKTRRCRGARLAGVPWLIVGLLMALGLSPPAAAQTLPAALDASWTFTTGGSHNWVGQTATKHDGVDAAAVAEDGGESSWLQTTRNFAGGTVSFYWMIAPEDSGNVDTLTLYVDGVSYLQISDNRTWHSGQVTLAAGTHTLRWVCTAEDDILWFTDGASCYVDQVVMTPNPSLVGALDTSGIVATGGEADWEYQTATKHDGSDAAQSRDIGESQSSSFEITRTFSAGYVGFWWKVSSEAGWDYLRFYIDGVEQAHISGSQDWAAWSHTISAGTHTLKWAYTKDASVSSGSDCGWVDQLVDGSLPTVSISAADPTATEAGPTPGYFVVARTGSTVLPLSVTYAVGGSATPGADYTALPGTVTIPAGSSSAGVYVNPVNDAAAEDTETVTATLTAGSLYALGTSSATVSIVSDELSTVTIAATDPTATEAGPTTGTFVVTRTAPLASALTVNYTVGGTAQNGADYASLSGAVTIPAGSPTVAITVSPTNDTAGEDDETVVLTLATAGGYVVGAADDATVTIVSNDQPTVTIAATDATATEAGPTTGTFVVTRTAPLAGALTVNYTVGGTAQNGADYASLSGTVTIGAGAATATITVSPVNDTAEETSETVVATLASGSYQIGAARAGTVAIASDDVATVTLTVTDETATEEGATTGTFTVTRAVATTGALTVHYTLGGTATQGSDYGLTPAAGAVTIPAGAESATITVTPVNDAVVEPVETVIATLTPDALYVIEGSGAEQVTITSDDLTMIGLGEAIDQPDWVLTPAGGAPWFGQDGATHDGADAGRSGAIGHGESSSFSTAVSVAGASELRFWWKVSSEAGHDFLSFRIDGVEMASISGAVDWEQRTFPLAAGTHTLAWAYAKDATGMLLDDAGWVDQVELNSLMVTYPTAAGVVKAKGKALDITWISDGAVGPAVSIELLKGCSTVRTIVASTENDGAFQWPIPTGLTSGTDYRIRITSLSNPTATDCCDAFFTISGGAMLTVSAPNLPTTSWRVGATYPVKWKKRGKMGPAVSIALFKGDAKIKTIAASTPNDGRHAWKVPALPPGNDYRVQVKCRSSRKVWDFSNTFFSIVGPSAAAAGEDAGPGIASTRDALYRIVWDQAAFPGPAVSIELWRDEEYLLTVAASAGNDGALDWLVPAALGGAENYRFKVSSCADPSVASFSAKALRLGEPSLEP